MVSLEPFTIITVIIHNDQVMADFEHTVDIKHNYKT